MKPEWRSSEIADRYVDDELMRSVAAFRNSLGGDSLYIPAGCEIDRLDFPHVEFIDAAYRSFLNNPQATLSSIAQERTYPPLQQWLRGLAKGDAFGVIVHRADAFASVQVGVSVACRVPNFGGIRHLRLPHHDTASVSLPYPLDDLYLATNGIIDHQDAFEASQFVPMADLRFNLANNFSIACYPGNDITNAIPFYRSDCGDYLLADGAMGYTFFYDDHSFRQLGRIESVLDSYFNIDLAHKRWNPFSRAR